MARARYGVRLAAACAALLHALTRSRRAAQTLPRLPGDRARGSGNFVLRDGQLVQGAGASAGARVATGVLDMGEARTRHAALIKRQHFGRTPKLTEPF